jgi:hypothetical protein
MHAVDSIESDLIESDLTICLANTVGHEVQVYGKLYATVVQCNAMWHNPFIRIVRHTVTNILYVGHNSCTMVTQYT